MIYSLLDLGDLIFAAGAGVFVVAGFLNFDPARASISTERLVALGLSLLGGGLIAHLF